MTSSGHHPRIGQPHDDGKEGPIAGAEQAAARISTPAQPLGPRQTVRLAVPFFVGVAATGGVAVTVGAIWLLSVAAQALLLIALGLFLAVGLEPVVFLVVSRGTPPLGRGRLGHLEPACPAGRVPGRGHSPARAAGHAPGGHRASVRPAVNDSSSLSGQLNERFQLQQKLEQFLNGSSSGVVSGVLSVGGAVVGTFADVLIVMVLTCYFLRGSAADPHRHLPVGAVRPAAAGDPAG